MVQISGERLGSEVLSDWADKLNVISGYIKRSIGWGKREEMALLAPRGPSCYLDKPRLLTRVWKNSHQNLGEGER